MRLIARGIAAGRLRTVLSGSEWVPAAGPALIVARHYHHLFDGVALLAAMPRPFHVLVTLDWARNRAARALMASLTGAARWPTLLRADAVSRLQKNSAAFSANDVLRYQRRALRECAALLTEGRILVVFPEGYPNIDPHYTPKSGDDEFLPFKAGFRHIALAAERRLGNTIPIIPAGLHYVAGRPWTAYVRFGPPVDRVGLEGARLIAKLEDEVKRLSAAN